MMTRLRQIINYIKFLDSKFSSSMVSVALRCGGFLIVQPVGVFVIKIVTISPETENLEVL